jgi:hypothetical protein
MLITPANSDNSPPIEAKINGVEARMMVAIKAAEKILAKTVSNDIGSPLLFQ